MAKIWNDCIKKLGDEVSAQDIKTYLEPLHPVHQGNTLKLLAPNRYVCDHVKKNLLFFIENAFEEIAGGDGLVQVEIGAHRSPKTEVNDAPNTIKGKKSAAKPYGRGIMDPTYTFETHVEGNSNQLARAAALQVAENPGKAYNPLFIHGDVGLGKTHLIQAAGHQMLVNNPKAKVLYVRSEIFVNDVVTAIKENAMASFKRHYRSLHALIIDDIQFLARKNQSQEEFFHTYSTLLEGQRQIIITSDKFPGAITNVDSRLISRFGSGLTVGIDPPEMETRVAILNKKATEQGVVLPSDVAFFVANAVRSNVRVLNGAFHRIIANARFTGRDIDVSLAREALRDLLAHQQQRLSVENIQQTVADYYKLLVSDLTSKRRTRDIARARQLAMYLAKEYTSLSLPRIGDRFGGRDHTTVLHAHRKIQELIKSDPQLKKDYHDLQRIFQI